MKNTALLTLVMVLALTAACAAPAAQQPEAPAAVTGQVESPTSAALETPAPPLLAAPGLGSIKLLTALEGGGARPLLAWEAVPGADRYQLLVFDEAGQSYWAWEGGQTQVYMGGAVTQPPEDTSGPSIAEGYTWAVVAYDTAGNILASSGSRPISP
jgi:hypothetical protein